MSPVLRTFHLPFGIDLAETNTPNTAILTIFAPAIKSEHPDTSKISIPITRKQLQQLGQLASYSQYEPYRLNWTSEPEEPQDSVPTDAPC